MVRRDITTRFARGGQVRGVVVSEANYVRWTNYVRRANYVRSTNYAEPRSSLQSVLRFALCSAFRKIPNFEKSSWIFFQLKNFCANRNFFPNLTFSKLIMKQISRNLRNIFFSSFIHHHSSSLLGVGSPRQDKA